jgi:hypothetical protein
MTTRFGTELHKRCVIEATIEPLRPFRRGFARSKAGPFFEPRTVQALVGAGLLRVVYPERGRSRIMISARAV